MRESEEKLKKTNQQLEDKLRKQSRYLTELLEMKNDFLRIVNHQLNTPLSVMKGCFYLMKEKIYTAEKALPLIENALEKLGIIINNFWYAYELEGGKMKMEPQKTDIKEILERQISEKQKLLDAKSGKLKCVIEKPDFEIPLVWCDYKKVVHAVSNLLDNAICYTGSGKISIYYRLLDNYLQINIKDTGIGLSVKDKKIIFQKFSRGENASNFSPEGLGLGLFFTKKIIEGNNGTVSYFSQGRNKGSIFRFTLPVYKDQEFGKDAEYLSNKKGESIVIFQEHG